MKSFWIAAVSALLLSTHAFSLELVSSSPSPMSEADLWNQYVGGPQGSPEKLTDLSLWLDSSQCTTQTAWILKNVDTYGKHAFSPKSKQADPLASTIYNYLLKLYTSKDPCFQDASAAYLLASVWITDRYDATGLSYIPTNAAAGVKGPVQNLFLLLLTKALLKANAIQFVGPTSCAIEFAYMCASGSIQLNPISKPLDQGGIYGSSPEDFAGHYFHELDHFFRDKFVDSSYVLAHFPDPTDSSGIDWKNYLLLDETLAKIFSGAMQVSDSTVSVYDGASANNVKNDLSLYQKDGPLYHLINSSDSGNSGFQLGIFSMYYSFLASTFLHMPYNNMVYDLGSPDQNTDMKAIYLTIQNSYFPGVDPTGLTINLTDKSSALDPYNQSLDFDPLTELLSARGWGTFPYVDNRVEKLPLTDVWPNKMEVGIKIGPFPVIPVYKYTGYWVVPIKVFLTTIQTLVDSMKTATPVCKLFNDRLTQAVSQAKTPQNALGSYFGGSCMGGAQPENGARTDDPSRPENGARTDDPSRPENGARTDSPSRP